MGACPGMQAGIGFTGALLPGMTSSGSAMALRGLARGGAQGRQRMAGNIEAFDAAGTVPTLSQATQSSAARRIETGLSKFPGGASVIADRAAEQNAQIGSAVDSIASRLAPRSDATSAGRAITRGV